MQFLWNTAAHKEGNNHKHFAICTEWDISSGALLVFYIILLFNRPLQINRGLLCWVGGEGGSQLCSSLRYTTDAFARNRPVFFIYSEEFAWKMYPCNWRGRIRWSISVTTLLASADVFTCWTAKDAIKKSEMIGIMASGAITAIRTLRRAQ